ncbi:MAG: carboxypeptidase regulatory-like domain-containing protein [Candidatus Wallbacteria bacterium]|nr:carboxypeptidase regulatory-like domain-containing protein [Candidatus Wallbacteria bacterium]
MTLVKRLIMTFLLFLLSVFIGCSGGSSTLNGTLVGNGVVAGRATVTNGGSDYSNIVITLDPEADSGQVLAAAERYERAARRSPSFKANLQKKMASASATSTLQANTNTDGNFTISKVPSGTYLVKAYKPKYVQNATPNVDVKPDQVSTVNVALESPGTLTGKVILQGESNSGGVICYLTNQNFVLSNDSGKFTFDSLQPGTYEITVKEYGFETYKQVVLIEKNKTKDLGEIVLEKIASQSIFGAIAGEVRSQNLSPLSSVEVTVKELPQFTTVTNSVGNYLFENLPAGKYTLRFEYLYWMQEVENVYVQSKHNTQIDPTYFDLTKPELGIIDGKIFPAAPSMVSIQKTGVEITSKILNNGTFYFPIEPGTYDLVIISAGFVTNTSVKGLIVEVGKTSKADITLSPAPGKLMGTIVDGTGAPVPNVQVDASGNKVFSGSAGTFLFENMPPGTYSFTFSKTGYQINKLPGTQVLISGENKDLGRIVLNKMPRNSVIATLNPDYTPGKVTVSNSLLYVLDQSHDLIHLYDKNTLEEMGTIATGKNPQHILVDDNYIYVANKWANTVSIFRKDTGVLFKDVEVGVYPVFLTKVDNQLLVTNFGSNTVCTISLSNYQVTDSMACSNGPVRVEKISGKIYVLCQLSQILEVYAADTHAKLAQVPVGLEASDMVKTDSYLVIVDSGSDNLINVALSNDSLYNTLSYGGTPVAGVLAGSTVYISASGNGFLYEISPTSLTMSDSINLGAGIEQLYYEDSTGNIYVSDPTLRKVFLVNSR